MSITSTTTVETHVVMLTESVSSNRARHCSLCCKTERVVPKPSSPCAFTRYARKMTSGGLLHQICVWRGHRGSGDWAPERQLGPAGGSLAGLSGKQGFQAVLPAETAPDLGMQPSRCRLETPTQCPACNWWLPSSPAIRQNHRAQGRPIQPATPFPAYGVSSCGMLSSASLFHVREHKGTPSLHKDAVLF